LRVVIALAAVCALVAGCGGDKTTPVAASSAGVNPKPRTLPDLHPPALTINHPAQGTSPGYVFVAEKGGKNRPSGPVIADNQGRIVWYHEVPSGLEATDFRTQTYKGKPVLTWWQGRISKAGIGEGSYVIYDSSYHQIATVKAAHGLSGDLHEFQLTPRGTAYISIYKEVPVDLRSVGGPKNGFAFDSVVQEIDVATGKVVFEWHSLDHVPLSESLQANQEPAHHATKKRPLDYFHVNSIADGPNGTILVSGRNTSTIYLLRRSDGSVIWRLGGKRSDFGPPAAVKFRFQHNARLHPGNLLSLFDNGAIPKVEPYTRPLVLKLDVAHKKARIVKTFVHPTKISSPFEGNLELLPDGGAFVGWGGVRKVTEFTPAGKVRFQMTLPYGDTYRGYRLEWTGKPGGRPLVDADGSVVYASWNGETGVARWQVLTGDDAQHLKPTATADWKGLETAIPLRSAPKALAVQALDASGRVLGQSTTLTS
jgi:outer membrane protein assembly factor BamB